jgi:hypothetical protein
MLVHLVDLTSNASDESLHHLKTEDLKTTRDLGTGIWVFGTSLSYSKYSKTHPFKKLKCCKTFPLENKSRLQ